MKEISRKVSASNPCNLILPGHDSINFTIKQDYITKSMHFLHRKKLVKKKSGTRQMHSQVYLETSLAEWLIAKTIVTRFMRIVLSFAR